MSKHYEPELGQAIFGNPWNELECPEWVEALLSAISDEIGRVTGNNTQNPEYPAGNRAAQYKNDVFEMYSYYWGDEEELVNRPNFKYGDFEVRWYKYLGRGTTMNREITPDEGVDMLDKCLASVRADEKPFF